MNVVWRQESREDLDQAFQWYQEQRLGLGTLFVRDIDTSLNLIAGFPRAYPVLFDDVRRMVLRRFPFGLYYLVEPPQIVVLAVLHLKRDLLDMLIARRRTI